MHQRNDLVGDRFLRKEAEMPRARDISRIVVAAVRWIDACIVVTLHHFLCVHSTNCITTFCSSTKKVDEEATPANFP
jgi:hypothetical protein